MLRDGRAGQREELDELTRAQLAIPEREQEPDAAFVGQGFGDVHELTHTIITLFRHTTK